MVQSAGRPCGPGGAIQQRPGGDRGLWLPGQGACGLWPPGWRSTSSPPAPPTSPPPSHLFCSDSESELLCHLCQMYKQRTVLAAQAVPMYGKKDRTANVHVEIPKISSCAGAMCRRPKNLHSLSKKIEQACLPCFPLFASAFMALFVSVVGKQSQAWRKSDLALPFNESFTLQKKHF